MAVIRLPKSWRLRYSLRALALLITVACIWLGMIASSARQQRIATELLRSVNATVAYDSQESLVPRWIREFVGDDFFRTVVNVQLHDQRDGRKSLPLPPEKLKLAVDAMRRLPNLRSIYFAHTRIRDDDLRHLAPLADQIESVTINEAWGDLTGEGLKHLAGWPRLCELNMVSAGHVDSAALKHVTAMPALESLCWTGTLDEAAFENIARCRRLKKLHLLGCWFEGQSLIKLRSAPRLQNLHLQNCSPEPHGVVVTVDSQTGTSKAAPPTTYHFRPAGDFTPNLWPQGTHYQQWLKNILPQINISEMYSS